MTLGVEVGLGPGHFVIDGDPAPLPKKGDRAPQFSVRVNCGQMDGWVKTVLGTGVGLSPGHIVLDWDPAPVPEKRGHRPLLNFQPLDLEIGLSPRVLDGDPAPLPNKWTEPPNFRPMSIVAKQLHGSRCHLLRR